MSVKFLEPVSIQEILGPSFFLPNSDYLRFLWKSFLKCFIKSTCSLSVIASGLSMAFESRQWLPYIYILCSVCFDSDWSCHRRYEEKDSSASSGHSPGASRCKDASDGTARLCRGHCKPGKQNQLPAVQPVLVFWPFCLHLLLWGWSRVWSAYKQYS